MSISANLIDLASLEEMESGKIIVPGELSLDLGGDFKIGIFIKSRKKIEIIGVKTRPGMKIYYIGLEIMKDYLAQVMQMMGKMISKNDLRWTTGICVVDEDVDYKGFDGCLWHGIVYIKDDVSIDDLKKEYMEINSEYDKRVVMKINIKEIRKKEIRKK